MGEFANDDEFYKWILPIFYLFEKEQSRFEAIWKQFSNEIIFNNRFSPKTEIISEIKKTSDAATRFLNNNSLLFRARIFDRNPYESYLKAYQKIEQVTEEEFTQMLEFSQTHRATMDAVFSTFTEETLSDPNNQNNPILIAYNNWKKNRFKGFNAKESLPPPTNQVVAGRANPDHIRYLYLSEDEETPLYEVRPTIGQYVSVAKFKTIQKLKIFDLTQIPTNNADNSLPSLFTVISKKFSAPYSGNPIEYLPTQYITEVIKNMGFDGLCFASSLHEEGKNIVIFDVNTCIPISSVLVQIKQIHLESELPSLFKCIEANGEDKSNK